MTKQWKPGKHTVELNGPSRPSRIRREPPREESRLDKVQWRTPEWEIRLAIVGIVLFALAINIITVAISAYTS